MTMTVLNRKGIPMTDDELLAAAHEMERRGGGFAEAIATAFFRADSTNQSKLLLTFGDLFVRYAPEGQDDTVAGVVRQISERVNGPWYALGWDIVAETMSDSELAGWVTSHGTLEATWQALAEHHRLPAQITGNWVVRTSDIDGSRITQHVEFSDAVQHFEQMLGRTPADNTLLRLETGTDNGIVGTSDYGTRVSLERI